MPIRRSKLSQEEQRKCSALALRLDAAGVPTGTSSRLLIVPNSLELRQLDYLFCRVHDLPGGQVVLILPSELVALRARAAIRDFVISLAWGPELDLCDPEDIPRYDDLIGGLPEWPPTVLNPWLRGEDSLPRGMKLTGIIIATGWVPIPAEICDESPVDIQISITDDQGSQLELLWKAGVYRGLKRAYERKQQTPAEALRLTTRKSLFECKDTEAGHQPCPALEHSRGPVPPSPVVVSVEKPIEGSSVAVPRDETEEPIGEL